MINEQKRTRKLIFFSLMRCFIWQTTYFSLVKININRLYHIHKYHRLFEEQYFWHDIGFEQNYLLWYQLENFFPNIKPQVDDLGLIWRALGRLPIEVVELQRFINIVKLDLNTCIFINITYLCCVISCIHFVAIKYALN